MKKILIGAVALMALAATSAYAVEYVTPQPFTGNVRDCRGGEGVNVPMITWGGDLIPIHANGDSITTQPGSVFANAGLSIKLQREDVFATQVEAYLSCATPYLRGTIGQLALATDITSAREATKMVIVYQYSWSNGGDALVVNGNTVSKPADLAGKTVALQVNGPHMAYLLKVLSDAGVDPKSVTFKFTKDLTGTDNTPMEAMLAGDVDAAMVIIPDALALTSGGTVGTGAEGSAKDAKILLSTKSASRVIADVLAVRSDYYKANKAEIQSLVRAMMVAEENLRKLVLEKDTRPDEYKKMLTAGATILLDAPTLLADTEGLYADAETVGVKGNQKFFIDAKYPRNFATLVGQVQTAYVGLNMMTATTALAHANWDYSLLENGLTDTGVSGPKFDQAKVSAAMTEKATTGNLSADSLFSFAIQFNPNQTKFSVKAYQAAFDKVVDLAATYPGAVITIEGHSDVLNYVDKKNKGMGPALLAKISQSARNLSVSRANAVRDTIITMAADNGFTLDVSQFVTVGHGISKPLTGMNGDIPLRPKSEAAWRSNMRVEFNLVNVEAETSSWSAK